MKKFNIVELKPMSTPMSIATSLDSDEDDEAVDQREYMSMIDSLKTKWAMVCRLRLKTDRRATVWDTRRDQSA
jgi:hypothetical protein